MRRSAVLTTLALAASTLVLAQPASAMRPLDPEETAAAKAGLRCAIGVVSADTRGRVRYDSVYNGRVKHVQPSSNRLRFDVDAWGEYTSVSKNGVRRLTMNAVTAKGVRRVTLTIRAGKKIALSSTKVVQRNFEPRLFADSYYFYAYTVNDRGQLLRWTLTRFRDGDVRYASKVVVARGFDSFTSLQATALYKLKGVWKEVLYGTTAEGALVQVTVPLNKPTNEKVRYLADTGYAGVTELSWSTCNGDWDHIALAAIDPVTGVGTWTTIKDANGRAKTRLRGEISGGKGWKRVTALY